MAAATGTFYGQHMTAGDVYTVAGNGKGLYSGDGGPAIDAGLDTATISVDPHGNLLLAGKPDANILVHGPSRVRIIAAVSGTFYGVPLDRRRYLHRGRHQHARLCGRRRASHCGRADPCRRSGKRGRHLHRRRRQRQSPVHQILTATMRAASPPSNFLPT